MPQLGPAFLHEQIALPRGASLETAARWFVRGLLAWLPASVRNIGWTPAYRLREGEQERGVDVSAAGTHRTSTALLSEDRDLPIAVVIDPRKVFITRAELPAAAKDLRAAVELRLDELSPLVPAEIEFAVGAARALPNQRIEVGVAIVRKTTLADIEAEQANGIIHSIGAEPDESGRLEFVFRSHDNRSGASRPALRAALLVAAMLFAAVSFDGFLSQRTKANERYAATLAEELKSLRASAAFLDGASPSAGASPIDVAETLAGLIDALPSGAKIEKIGLDGATLVASGAAPIGALWTGDAVERRPSLRPGFDDFTLRLPTESSDG